MVKKKEEASLMEEQAADKCESTEQSPQSSLDDWGSFTPPKAVRAIYKGATYTGMVVGIVLAFPFMTVTSAKKWYEKSKGEKADE